MLKNMELYYIAPKKVMLYLVSISYPVMRGNVEIKWVYFPIFVTISATRST